MRRILVALDASPASFAACAAAAELAAALHAELSGLFVEDVELLRSAALPEMRELGQRTAHSRRFEVAALEAQLRAEAQRARSELSRIAAQAHVAWSFHIARGVVSGELVRAAERADLVTLGSVGHGERIGRRVGSTVRALQRAGHGRLMLLRPGMHVDGPARVVLGAVEDVARLMGAGLAVTRHPHAHVDVIAWAKAARDHNAMADAVHAHLVGHDVAVRFEPVLAGSVTHALGQVPLDRPGILVLDALDPGLARDVALSDIVRRSGAPVLLVS